MSTIEKPCIRQCCLDTHDICMGCFRSLDDMKAWHKASIEDKKKILEIATQRKTIHKVKYR